MKNRRLISCFFGLVLSATVLPALNAQAEELVITSWGSAYQDAQRQAYFEPFTKETGIKIIEATGPDAAKIKSMVASGNVEWDVVDIGLSTALVLGQQDLLTPIDYSKFDAGTLSAIPADFRLDNAVGNETWSVVLAYRTDRYKEPPTNWKDFWNVEKFPGKRAFLDSSFVAPILEIALLADGVEPKSMYPVDIPRALKSLSALRPNVLKWTGSSGVMQQMLTDGQVDMAAIANGRMEGLQKAGVPVGFTFHQQMLLSNYWAVPKGAKNSEAAMKFIAFVSRAEQQANFAKLAPWGPTNKDAFKYIPEERQKDLPTSPANLDGAVLSNGQWWAEKTATGPTNLEVYLKAWNEWWLSGR